MAENVLMVMTLLQESKNKGDTAGKDPGFYRLTFADSIEEENPGCSKFSVYLDPSCI